jgi:RNA polymerase sigma-70 factor (ECF subfamily)
MRSLTRRRRAVERMDEGAPSRSVPTPEADVRRSELAAALARGLDTLSVDHREVFVLCAVEERSSPEVADILDVPEGTIRQRLFHAKKKLRAFLEREGIE